MASSPVGKTKRRTPRAAKPKVGAGLPRKALDFLVSRSPTPAIFDNAPDHPPFQLEDQ